MCWAVVERTSSVEHTPGALRRVPTTSQTKQTHGNTQTQHETKQNIHTKRTVDTTDTHPRGVGHISLDGEAAEGILA